MNYVEYIKTLFAPPSAETLALREFEESKRELWLTQSVSGTYLISGGNGVTWATVSSNIEPNFTIDIDQTPITIRSKEKPNLFRRYIYKILGMKWKVK
jgi:hypothetical protein